MQTGNPLQWQQKEGSLCCLYIIQTALYLELVVVYTLFKPTFSIVHLCSMSECNPLRVLCCQCELPPHRTHFILLYYMCGHLFSTSRIHCTCLNTVWDVYN